MLFITITIGKLLKKTKKNPTIEKHVSFLRSEKGNQVKNTILKEHENYFNKPKRSFKKVISLTAAIAAILTIGFFLFNTPSNNLYNNYKNNWQELPSLTLRGENTNITKVETLFANKKYDEALNALNSFTGETNTSDPQILVYKGVLNLELNNNQKAIEVFKELQNSNSIDAFKSHWYLALAYLKITQNELALHELKQLISKTKIFKNKEAIALIEELK